MRDSVSMPFSDWIVNNRVPFTTPYDSAGYGPLWPPIHRPSPPAKTASSQFMYLGPISVLRYCNLATTRRSGESSAFHLAGQRQRTRRRGHCSRQKHRPVANGVFHGTSKRPVRGGSVMLAAINLLSLCIAGASSPPRCENSSRRKTPPRPSGWGSASTSSSSLQRSSFHERFSCCQFHPPRSHADAQAGEKPAYLAFLHHLPCAVSGVYGVQAAHVSYPKLMA